MGVTTAPPSTPHAADRLIEAMDRAGAPACVGLDPVLEKLPPAVVAASAGDPAAAIERFSLGVLEACAGIIGAVKPQSACYERYGAAGVAALERVCAEARRLGFAVILDVKRGDIGVTAEHYAQAAFGVMGADFATISGSMGPDTIEPWLAPQWADRGVFVLVRTSNPGSDALQSVAIPSPHPAAAAPRPASPARGEGAETVAERMARMVDEIGASRVGTQGFSNVGAVVAATKPADAARLRALMPRAIFLVPGFGAQGGTTETVRELFDAQGRGAVVTASRSVIYPGGERWGEAGHAGWTEAVREAAGRLRQELAAVAEPG